MSGLSLAAVEALLFSAPVPLSLKRLAELLDCTVAEAQTGIQQLKLKLAGDGDCGLMVDRVAHGYRLATKPDVGHYVERVSEVVKSGSLSNAAMETLAIVAYRQPVTRVEVEQIRGVRSDSAVNALLERGLIEEQGRKDAPGRPVMFGTTQQFLLHFGLNDVTDLPPLPVPDTSVAALPLD